MSGTITLDYNPRACGPWLEYEFTADGIEFPPNWVVLVNPLLTSRVREAGYSTPPSAVQAIPGFHRLPLRRVARLTYDRCERAA